MAEQLANNASSTLTAGVDNVTNPVTVSVASAAKFPSGGDFRIKIGTELLKVTAVAGNDFTASRAQEGTVIQSHSNGDAVTCVLTVEALLAYIHQNSGGVSTGTLAGRPAAGQAGRAYYTTDTPFWYYDNGSTWDKFYGSIPIITPDETGYSWDNQGSSTLTLTKDMYVLNNRNNGANFRYKTAPATPYTLEVAYFLNGWKAALCDVYLGFRDSGTGKIVAGSARTDSGTSKIGLFKWTNSTTFSAAYLDNNHLEIGGQIQMMRMVDDGTDFKFYTSNDSVTWVLHFTISRTDFLATPDQILWGGATGDASKDTSTTLIHRRVF
jgi:hypothetical protein